MVVCGHKGLLLDKLISSTLPAMTTTPPPLHPASPHAYQQKGLLIPSPPLSDNLAALGKRETTRHSLSTPLSIGSRQRPETTRVVIAGESEVVGEESQLVIPGE